MSLGSFSRRIDRGARYVRGEAADPACELATVGQNPGMTVASPAGAAGFVEHLPVTQAALAFAAERHAGQRRESDHAAFLLHPLEVGWLLYSSGRPDKLVAAGVLHDVLEDTSTDASELRERFGPFVAETVCVMTEDAEIDNPDERKAGLRRQVERAGAAAAAVFAADKVSKVRELRIRTACEPASADSDATRSRMSHYKESLAMLERVLGEDRLVRELRFELETLIALPPAITRC